MTETDISVRISQYRKIRAHIAEIKDRQKAELVPIQAMLDQLGGILDEFLTRTKQTSAATKEGTCYRTTRFTATVSDGAAFMDHVIANQAWDLIERRASATAVRGFIEDHKHPVPGVDLNAITSVGVKAPTGKAKLSHEKDDSHE